MTRELVEKGGEAVKFLKINFKKKLSFLVGVEGGGGAGPATPQEKSSPAPWRKKILGRQDETCRLNNRYAAWCGKTCRSANPEPKLRRQPETTVADGRRPTDP